jgi:hypothetical protein
MEFIIPSKYTVGGQDVTVEHVESDGDYYGNYTHCMGRLRICNKAGDTPQSDTAKLNTFFHELTHSILRTMGEDELNSNEKFVNCFAGFLTEAIRTME